MKQWAILFLSIAVLQACSSSKISKRQEAKTVYLDEIEVVGKRLNPILDYQASAPRINDLIHTRLECSLDWEKQQMPALATLSFKPFFYPTDSLILQARGMQINSVQLLIDEVWQPVQYQYDSLELRIQLDRTYTRDEQYQVAINYIAKPEELKLHKKLERWAKDKGLYFVNPLCEDKNIPRQVWTQNEPLSASCWIPIIDHPNERTTQEFVITVDPTLRTLSNGHLANSNENPDGSRTDTWVQLLPHPPYVFTLVAGDFAVVEDRWRDKEVSYYLDHDYEQYARDIFGNTPEMLEYYSNILAFDYPWDKYSQVVVHDFFSGAMENTSASTFWDGMLKDKRELIDEDHEDIVAHELFHQWFGDLVTCENWANLALNEALATYGEYLWIEHKYGKEEADLHLRYNHNYYMNEAQSEQKDLIRYYHDDPDDMFDRHSYDKGGTIMHMLRNVLGDDAFFTGMSHYLHQHAYQAVEADQLRLAFEAVSGQDLHWFFDQWFFGKGHPELTVSTTYDSGYVHLNIQQQNSNEEKKLWKLPAKVDVYVNGEIKRHHIEINRKNQVLKWPYAQAPDLVNFDAQRTLTCDLTYNKSAAEYRFQYENAPLFMDRYEALKALQDMQEDSTNINVLIDAMKDPFWFIRQYATSTIAADGYASSHIKERILSASKDRNAKVRRAAIERIAEWENAEYIAYLTQGMEDSSYAVVGSSLEGLLNVDPEAAYSTAGTLESSTNPDILDAVATIYADQGNEKDQAFFEDKLANTDGVSQYYIVYRYSDYIGKMNKDIGVQGIESIKKVGQESDETWMRFATKSALGRISTALGIRKDQAKQQLNNTKKSNEAAYASAAQNLDDVNALIEAAGKALVELEQ